MGCSYGLLHHGYNFPFLWRFCHVPIHHSVFVFGDKANAEADALPLGINLDNPDGYILAGFHDLSWVVNAAIGQFRDMDKSFDSLFQPSKGTEIGQVCDHCIHHLADGVPLHHAIPWVWHGPAYAEANAFFLPVDVEDEYIHFLPNFYRLARMFHSAPGYLGDMHQAIGSSQIHKSAKWSDAGDAAMPYFAFLERLEEFFLLGPAPFAQGSSFGEDKSVPLAVQLDDFQEKFFAYKALPQFVGFPVRLMRRRELRCRHKAAKSAHLDDKTSAVEARHRSLERFSTLVQAFRLQPVMFLFGLGYREDQVSLSILRPHDVDQNLLPWL